MSEEGRWVTSKTRNFIDAKVLLRKIIDERVMIPKNIRSIKFSSKILDEEKIQRELIINPFLNDCLKKFLSRDEFWMEKLI